MQLPSLLLLYGFNIVQYFLLPSFHFYVKKIGKLTLALR